MNKFDNCAFHFGMSSNHPDKISSKDKRELVIAQFVVWENPNPSHKCVTQLGTTITVTSIDVPLILVKDKSNTREASR
jgi:hypothetical protein